MAGTSNVVKRAIEYSAVLLARFGLIDEARGIRTADLAWPRVVTGLTRMSQRTFDFAMVGLALGPAAIAGMGFAFTYWTVAMGFGFSLANGAMTLMSQRFGADDAWTPMVIRGGGAVINIVLNVIFIFGLGWGVFGAALGTLLATAAVTVTFAMFSGELPGIGSFPLQLRSQRPHFDLQLSKQLMKIAAPLMGKRLVSRGHASRCWRSSHSSASSWSPPTR